ncbi:MAG: amidohydrolase, partial [Betaproteobacteria bacterium]|nr:amidohydrolase [Betaproteobacteria bacterium]
MLKCLSDTKVQEFIAPRRDIHQHPEMAFEEHRTSELVAQKLRSWGYQVWTGIGGTGVVGQLVRGTSSRAIGL